MQTTNTIFLVRPANFSYNAETAISNAFQNKSRLENSQEQALLEFDNFAHQLKSAGIDITIFEDTPTPIKPDAIFPNNWISIHPNGTMILYPMMAANRQKERSEAIITQLKEQFEIKKIIDLSVYEKEQRYLEGTGSIIYDHTNKIAYACLSPRTEKELFIQLCETITYQPIFFNSVDEKGKAIYHTNVMMALGEKVAIVCLESITNLIERQTLMDSLNKTGHEIIDISLKQVAHFAGNMLELRRDIGKNLLVMSSSAYQVLDLTQKQLIEKHCKLFPLNISTIESIGGGSVRCMMAEIFAPKY